MLATTTSVSFLAVVFIALTDFSYLNITSFADDFLSVTGPLVHMPTCGLPTRRVADYSQLAEWTAHRPVTSQTIGLVKSWSGQLADAAANMPT